MSDTPSSAPSQDTTVLVDLKRLLPVWVLAFAGAVGALMILRHSGARYLLTAVERGGDPCQVAAIREQAGLRIHRQLLRDVARAQQDRATPQDPAAPSALGILKGDPRLDEARGPLAEAVAGCPNSHYLYRDLSQLAYWQGDEAAAHELMGRYFRASNLPADAAVEFRLALDAEPDRASARIELAKLRLDQSDTTDALALLSPLLDRLEELPGGTLAAARLAEARGDRDSAWELAKEAVRLVPADREAFAFAQRLADGRTRWVESGDFFAEVAALPGALAGPTHHLAGIFYRNGEAWPQALGQFSRAAELLPRNHLVQFDHATELWRSGDFAGAKAAYQRAAEADLEGTVALRLQSPIDPTAPGP
ncbi:MAG: tetratricopeptide repeat protein [Candidatus Sumerlaeia bacterium]|nr:tetratricopeptide repeat protein [Candidatus Sumerlaeia bacterium]